ncbi:MAG: 30S ribosomal protein S13 [Puniceicoccales bacterium]|jgi:small subunit ribosomal protein S13|nr:30S ribosomal protein S13 [Puniceicoccales bacterium]
MPRILGVDIPDNKKIVYALMYIQGIGLTRAQIIVLKAGLDQNMRSHELNEEHINRITSVINGEGWKIEGDLRREFMANLKRLQAIKSYRGMRHYRGLPVRGQRTSTNARTRKGVRKTVGVMKKSDSKSK